jgi:hypothetical protein
MSCTEISIEFRTHNKSELLFAIDEDVVVRDEPGI